jgi:hypothetical protein
MSKTSTPQFTSVRQRRSTIRRQQAVPKPTTIAFLKQFARAYTFEPSVCQALGGYVAN